MQQLFKKDEILSINQIDYDDIVYNLELESKNKIADDLFWVEGTTNIITHNCLPKDTAAMAYVCKKLNIDVEFFADILKENDKRVKTVFEGMRKE